MGDCFFRPGVEQLGKAPCLFLTHPEICLELCLSRTVWPQGCQGLGSISHHDPGPQSPGQCVSCTQKAAQPSVSVSMCQSRSQPPHRCSYLFIDRQMKVYIEQGTLLGRRSHLCWFLKIPLCASLLWDPGRTFMWCHSPAWSPPPPPAPPPRTILPLATRFLPQIPRFSFDHDITSCIKLKTGKYPLIYSHSIFWSHHENLSLTMSSSRSPRSHSRHQAQHKSARSPRARLPSRCPQPRWVFPSHAFSATGCWGRGKAHFPFPKLVYLPIPPSKQPGFRGMLVCSSRSQALGFRLLSALGPELGLWPRLSVWIH